MSKIAVFYYSQSGQARLIAEQMFNLQCDNNACAQNDVVIYKQIIPVQSYPYPWDNYVFFDTFPETRLGNPPSGVKNIDFTDIQDVDLVVIVGQPWFLSPSLPIQSFFADDEVKKYLSGRKVIFVNVCRNMWVMTTRMVKGYLKDINAKLIAHITFQDNHPNLISAITIVRWMMYGKKEASIFFPMAGVSNEDITHSSRFGQLILEALHHEDVNRLQEQLLENGSIKYKPSIVFIEKIGYRMFGKWAQYIKGNSGFRDTERSYRVKIFTIYLISVLFLLSPLVQLFFYLSYPLWNVKSNKQKDCSL